MQNVGITTKLRDAWEDAAEDSVIDATEQAQITTLVVQADDSMRLGLTVMKVGTDSRDTKQRIRVHERLHGPIDIRPYQRRRAVRRILRYRETLRSTAKRPTEATPQGAA